MRALLIFAFIALQGAAASAQQSATDPADQLTDEQRAALESVIRDYLINNPEVIEDAIFVLQDRRAAEREERERAAIDALSDGLLNDPADFSVGPADAPVQIVEFFDYNCGYCRSAAPWVRETIAAHPDEVRVVFKETPIFAGSSESSELAARAALAAAAVAPDQYLDFHFALMGASGTIPASQVRQIAENVGLDWRDLQAEMEAQATQEQLDESVDLLYEIGAGGTPAFIVNGELVAGADLERLDALLNAGLGEGE